MGLNACRGKGSAPIHRLNALEWSQGVGVRRVFNDERPAGVEAQIAVRVRLCSAFRVLAAGLARGARGRRPINSSKVATHNPSMYIVRVGKGAKGRVESTGRVIPTTLVRDGLLGGSTHSQGPQSPGARPMSQSNRSRPRPIDKSIETRIQRLDDLGAALG